MLKFLIDHNIPRSVGVFLKQKGYNVKLVKDVDPQMTDLQLLKVAKDEDRIVLSNDKDFITLSQKFRNVDMILLSYFDQSSEIRIKGLKKVLPALKSGFGILVLS
jgi:predicted nuclease of predicted toxin-antitoxin system